MFWWTFLLQIFCQLCFSLQDFIKLVSTILAAVSNNGLGLHGFSRSIHTGHRSAHWFYYDANLLKNIAAWKKSLRKWEIDKIPPNIHIELTNITPTDYTGSLQLQPLNPLMLTATKSSLAIYRKMFVREISTWT